MSAIFAKRDEQIRKAIKLLEHKTRQEAMSIILLWLPMETVEIMIKQWESHG